MTSHDAADVRGPEAALPSLRRALAGWRPPMDRREFWLVQVLVVVIAAGHSILELVAPAESHAPLYLLPISLFVVPIMYAALNFGLRGAVQTTIWCSVLSVPNIVLLHADLESWGEVVQLLGLSTSAFFIGWWVDRERAARLQAEEREHARRTSEERYRAIFDTVDEPIAVLDADGAIVEANTAAARLIGAPVADIRGRHLPESLRSRLAPVLASPHPQGREITPVRFEHDGAWIEAHGTPIVDPSGRERTQLVLRDVTADHERAQGLEGIARQALAAREAEQRRIAREIHDGPVQSLILLVRELDALPDLGPGQGGVGHARTMAVQVTDQLRKVSRDLRPSILDDLGLPSALGSLAHQFDERTGVRSRLVVTGAPVRLQQDVETMLLRVAEEALRNVERHSRAGTARVQLAFAARGVTLTVADDGRGAGPMPSPSDLLTSNRLGVIGMRERARLAGAQLTVRSPRSGGFVVRVVVPAAVGYRPADGVGADASSGARLAGNPRQAETSAVADRR